MIKTVLVTGGAGEIGSAICKRFAENGYSVIITYNSNAQKAEELLQVLNKISKELIYNSSAAAAALIIQHSSFHAPTTNPEKVAELKAFVAEKYGKLDVLINNAGITTPVPHDDLESLTDEWIDKIMQTNFRGSFAMCRAMKDLMVNAAAVADEKTETNSSFIIHH
jgi:3-oxoacyl-[acyl-carrier protein] reductase